MLLPDYPGPVLIDTRARAVALLQVILIQRQAAIAGVILVTLSGLVAARPISDREVQQRLETALFEGESTQSCNTNCQERQTDCAIKCDQDAPCIQLCRAAAEDCVKKCTSKATDAGAPVALDAAASPR